jgi:uncharacterized phage protein (TIGR02220 family)
MRWFKHLVAANRDEKLLQIIDVFGMEGYGVYWIILEMIAEKITKDVANGEDVYLELSPQNWRKVTRFSPKKWQKYLTFLQKLGIFSAEIEENLIRVYCPNLLKYRDEYTQRRATKISKISGQTPMQDTETETEAEVEVKKVKKVKKAGNENKEDIYPFGEKKNGVPYEKIVAYLNEKSNRNFKTNSKDTREKIRARWNDGFRYEDFVRAIDSRVAKWAGDKKMSEFIRPSTIFGTKFEGYANDPIEAKAVGPREFWGRD